MLLPFLRWPMHRRYGRSGRLRWLAMLAPFILLFGYIVSGFLGVRFDSPWAVLRHLAAFPNCSTARAEPGYWPTHDADHDGIACEP